MTQCQEHGTFLGQTKAGGDAAEMLNPYHGVAVPLLVI